MHSQDGDPLLRSPPRPADLLLDGIARMRHEAMLYYFAGYLQSVRADRRAAAAAPAEVEAKANLGRPRAGII